jgi:APA family basic amino acid/polyamine antiporter
VLWAYEGWHVVSFAGGEMRRPGTDLPRSLGFGTLIILGLYVLANTSYYTVLTPAEIGSNPAVAAVAMEKSFGLGAGQFIAVLILISVIGSMNGMVMTGPRAYYAMSQDRMFFEVFGRLSKESRSPVFGLLLQGAWASILTCSGTYQQLFTDVIFTAWLFYGMTVAGVVVLRWRAPELKRLYRVPLFPLVPVVFCFAALAISVSAIAESPLRSLAGLGLILTGIPFFLFFLRRSHASSAGQDTVRSSSVVERAP